MKYFALSLVLMHIWFSAASIWITFLWFTLSNCFSLINISLLVIWSYLKSVCLHDFLFQNCAYQFNIFFEFRSTQSIGLLSYTFLRSTGKEDIVVPMVSNCIPHPIQIYFLISKLKCNKFSYFSALEWRVSQHNRMDIFLQQKLKSNVVVGENQ